MTFEEYHSYFENLLKQEAGQRPEPYDNPDYFEYTRLNWSRLNRWLKTGKLSDETINVMKNIKEQQLWIVITEPWCGDAAHIVPFIELISRQNPNVSVNYELRDSEPNRINDYLTNNSKSIPKLIIRNSDDKDLAVWGPRPDACQQFYLSMKEKGMTIDTIKLEIQNWYNDNKGAEVQRELVEVLTNLTEHKTKELL
ncbi:MAG: thioredoxin family protein [Bacteroidetes bacterium]|jgi:hypothetical protein|nr:thioredoxin family protein [Bacteroidota bacterium]